MFPCAFLVILLAHLTFPYRDSGNVDGIEDDAAERNVIYVEGSEEQQAVRMAFEALLREGPMSLQQYQANWDLAPWGANVDLMKRKAMIDARVRKMNGEEYGPPEHIGDTTDIKIDWDLE
ncbi:hypothetical protein C8F04DRAFT_1194676 [Mycena alexandri]|uniref:Uncharacterized protein n=1 Tax=Mycena alexandri TaxID=1745969 RepID=A0AAD6S7G2_9AGAR|nr:hypothetical protein C8F04DRAFT_1194676 [Mycena alexandri]